MARKLMRSTLAVFAMIALIIVGGACAHVMMMMGGGPGRPAESEFGMGPRRSAAGRYNATLEAERRLYTRQLQSVRLLLSDSSGAPVDGASITIDGGMPQHGHGLPTQPRVTAQLGNGAYQVDGLKFNMGGWWELKFRIAGAEPDSITFNLAL